MAIAVVEERSLLRVTIPSNGFREELGRFADDGSKLAGQVGLKRYDWIATLGRFEIVAFGDLGRREYRCAQYAFATIKQEPWAKEDEYIPIFDDPIKFLRLKGYRGLVIGEIPAIGDLVVYGHFGPNRPFELGHIGILAKDNPIAGDEGRYLVESKVNLGHALRHPLWAVPQEFGNDVLFFRRQPLTIID